MKRKFTLNKNTNFLAALLALLVLTGSCTSKTAQKATEEDPWKEMEQVRKLIKAPTFPNRDFLITSYGAVEGGKVKNTEAFKKAIQACHDSGGGRVVVPNGTFLTGAIHLKSNVNLHLQDNATILFSPDAEDYLPMVFTRWEGMELMNYSPFIYAYKQENIGITGNGTLDGGSNNNAWWNWNGAPRYGWKEGMPKQTPARAQLQKQNLDDVPPRERIYGPGYYLRPQFVQPYDCKNVVISGIKMINSPMWNLNPVLCENVTIEKVRIISLGPNNDGCDPESCKNVLIKDCYFDTGDDCIAIKSGRNNDGRRIARPAENHIIEGCEMKEGHGGVVIGSEISGGARNIWSQNLVMDSPQLDRVLRIKTSSQRGGTIENIYMRNVKVGTYKEAAVKCNMFYEEPGQHMPVIRNVLVENMVVENGGKYAVMVRAYEESPVENLRLVNCTINGVEQALSIDHVKDMKLINTKINGKTYDSNNVTATTQP
ncbi:glycoside hydrolase family 28 protein [Botryobacter ruber]|uniref:glycoside hydrolase family 28 protein n=1 Tax=Botryobacter ruber TaxID=2171629 RepID=UPI000E0B5DCA|nr:glycoside hydrolase family 28 protein [Botryobacter ruber]